MDKSEKKKLAKQWRENEKQAFFDSLPMPQEIFGRLFDYLDEQLGKRGCSHDLANTAEFLRDNNIDLDDVREWLHNQGGYCDCEVLANIEQHFD